MSFRTRTDVQIALLIVASLTYPQIGLSQSDPKQCQSAVHFAPEQRALSPEQAQLIRHQGSLARSNSRPLRMTFSSTNSDPTQLLAAREESIRSILRELEKQGVQMEVSATADLYFNSDLFFDACE